MSESVAPERRPLFSLVSACYQVSAFLPEFIAAIDAQDLDESLFEVIVVDDGSTDATGEILDRWAARRPGVIRVVHQANGGQGAARNTGIELARGEWVTFPDPDDLLDPDYLSTVRSFLEKNQKCDLVAVNRWLLNDTTGETSDSHPLRHLFGQDKVQNIALREQFFHGGAVTGFFRAARLAELALRFDQRIRPNFEDGHFTSVYLLSHEEPRVGFIGSTRYLYRKRADGTSTLQNALGNPGRYTDVLQYGYLDLLDRARELRGHVPLWLHNFLFYELNYYVGREDSSTGTLAPPEARPEFHRLMGEIAARLDPQAVLNAPPRILRPLTRRVLLHGWCDDPWVSDEAVVRNHDVHQGLVLLTYRFVGELPTERVVVGNRELVPHATKTRDVVVQGRTVMRERLLWVPSRRVRLQVAGNYLPLLDEDPEPVRLTLRPAALADQTEERARADVTAQLDRGQRLLLRHARGRQATSRYRDAWVLMDRIHNADDSAEHLFEFLRQRRPSTNAWFVIEEGTADFRRLRDLHGSRVVAHGSKEWTALMLNACLLISSHADIAVLDPPELRPYGRRDHKVVFLQHGVIKDDLSGWLNARPIDLFVTSTTAEYDSVVADNTSYRYTTKETVLTGLPRFDRLHVAGLKYPPEKRDLVLVSPTWRDQLVPPLEPGSQRRGTYDWFADTDYMQNWSAYLSSPELKDAVEREGLTLALLPHPNMERALEGVALPSHVTRFSFDDVVDVREIFARAAVLVTDYSSTAFNSAYINRPVVYFQFDAHHEDARHVGLPGYFDYERDGFGPVTHSVGDAVDETVQTIRAGRDPRTPWAERIEATFPFRDASNSARVFSAIRKSLRPAKVNYR